MDFVAKTKTTLTKWENTYEFHCVKCEQFKFFKNTIRWFQYCNQLKKTTGVLLIPLLYIIVVGIHNFDLQGVLCWKKRPAGLNRVHLPSIYRVIFGICIWSPFLFQYIYLSFFHNVNAIHIMGTWNSQLRNKTLSART